MKKLTSDEIRDIWLDFFKKKGHFVEPSASLIPNNDPTLLWINAGVSALKKYFDGTMTAEHKRITNAQKCIRTNDIENVGHTSRHHTFFEMLGNFSIGDYFRKEVIPWAVELLTSQQYYGIDKDKLFITYYPDDKETHDLWVSLGIDETHLIASEDNFWEIGEGPCGPDTEIYFDRGEKYDPEHLGIKLIQEDIENDRYIELWNIVFSQFNSESGKKRKDYKPLPQKNIDTGAGLERFVCIMQDAETNFDTDLFLPVIKEIEKKAKYRYEGEHKISYRIVADHIRSITFALSDGASFSNEGRGYVLRRLLRRASRHLSKLGLETGELSKLVRVVSLIMSHFYPYLLDKQEQNVKSVLEEEEKFSSTLITGEKMLDEIIKKSPLKISAEDSFKLYDTYGLPFDITEEIANEKHIEIDKEGFNILLEKSKELARNSRKDEQSFALQEKDLLNFKTPSYFIYEDEIIQSEVIGLFVNGKKVDEINSSGEIALSKTNFYAEMGGEVADTGEVYNDSFKAKVTMVKKANHQQHLLHIEVVYGTVKLGDILTEKPDFETRKKVRKNHSATHLLQSALQSVLNDNVHQAGAYYDDKCLRLDFNYPKKLTEEELTKIERLVNEKIEEGLEVYCKIMKKDEALKLNAMHLFSEKYADDVRVIFMGDFSIEFCGGLHVSNTKDIQLFVIESETAISSGVRRIVAYTGNNALEYLKSKQQTLNEIASLVKLNSDKGVKEKVIDVLNELDNCKKTVKSLEDKIAHYKLDSLLSKIVSYEKYDLLAETLSDLSHQQEESIVRNLLSKNNKLIVFLAVKNGNKVDLIVARNDELKEIKAGKIIQAIAPLMNGRGGGKDDLAFGGASSIDLFDKAKEKLLEIIHG